MAITNVNNDNIRSILDETWSWSKAQGLKGYNKHDGLNSPFLHFTLGWSKWARIIAIQSVMRSPINLRPFLHVKKSYNPKGLALSFLASWTDIKQKVRRITCQRLKNYMTS